MVSKVIELNKTVYELCSNDPKIADILVEIGFADITKPGMLQTAGRFMTIPKGSTMKKINMETVKQSFLKYGYEIKE